MQDMPLIGVTASHGFNEVGNSQFIIRENYLTSILRAGGLPVVLPAALDEETIRAYLPRLDGLLLSGGGDIDPAYFGEAIIPECGEIDTLRDGFEMKLAPLAIAMNMPVFGICRGIQVLTVALGGTLYQDVEKQTGIVREKHYQNAPYDKGIHEVTFTKGGLLERITGAERMHVNSTHHQCAKTVGDRLTVEAMSTDGLIEGVAMKGSERVYGVQFHPEHFSHLNPDAMRLFEYLVEQAKIYHAEKKA